MRELRTDNFYLHARSVYISSKVCKYEGNMNILMHFFKTLIFSVQRGVKMTDIKRKFKLPSYFFTVLGE